LQCSILKENNVFCYGSNYLYALIQPGVQI
jgi:hypothetical protein